MKEKSNIIKYTASIMILLIISIILYYSISRKYYINDIKVWILNFGMLAPIIYIIMFSLVPLTFFPDSILAISGGMMFGLMNGYIYTTIGALLGSSISFYISRLLGRTIVKKVFEKKLKNIEDLINKKGFIMILILRLIPLFPFDLISYGSGLTSIKFKDYFFATLIGTIPGILVFTNIGAQCVNIGQTTFYMSIVALIVLVSLSV
ncbi:TVP38/TMEM64 family protein, partial [Clostridium tarantellae]